MNKNLKSSQKLRKNLKKLSKNIKKSQKKTPNSPKILKNNLLNLISNPQNHETKPSQKWNSSLSHDNGFRLESVTASLIPNTLRIRKDLLRPACKNADCYQIRIHDQATSIFDRFPSASELPSRPRFACALHVAIFLLSRARPPARLFPAYFYPSLHSKKSVILLSLKFEWFWTTFLQRIFVIMRAWSSSKEI